MRDLRVEEARAAKELAAIRTRIAALSKLGGSGGGGGAGKTVKRVLSPAAREAIAKAARRRWAKYRAEKAKNG
jgi:50S ribosomal subunit-associated GTPase HflX